MSNFNDFLKSGIPEMIIGALSEAAQEVAQEEASLKAKTDVEAKAPTVDLAKKAAERIGEEACKATEEFATGLYYTYSSFIAAGFSATQAFELTRCTLIG